MWNLASVMGNVKSAASAHLHPPISKVYGLTYKSGNRVGIRYFSAAVGRDARIEALGM